MTFQKRSHRVSPLTKSLRSHASFFGIDIISSHGITDENFYDAMSLVNEFSELVKHVPPSIRKVLNSAASPETGLRLRMCWRRYSDKRKPITG